MNFRFLNADAQFPTVFLREIWAPCWLKKGVRQPKLFPGGGSGSEAARKMLHRRRRSSKNRAPEFSLQSFRYELAPQAAVTGIVTTFCFMRHKEVSQPPVREASRGPSTQLTPLQDPEYLLCLSQALLGWFGPLCSDQTSVPNLPQPLSHLGHKGHRPGQAMGLMQRPWNSTRLAGQWQPATQGLWHGPISFQLSQVLVQPGPQVSYTAPCLHWVAEETVKVRKIKVNNSRCESGYSYI